MHHLDWELGFQHNFAAEMFVERCCRVEEVVHEGSGESVRDVSYTSLFGVVVGVVEQADDLL